MMTTVIVLWMFIGDLLRVNGLGGKRDSKCTLVQPIFITMLADTRLIGIPTKLEVLRREGNFSRTILETTTGTPTRGFADHLRRHHGVGVPS